MSATAVHFKASRSDKAEGARHLDRLQAQCPNCHQPLNERHKDMEDTDTVQCGCCGTYFVYSAKRRRWDESPMG